MLNITVQLLPRLTTIGMNGSLSNQSLSTVGPASTFNRVPVDKNFKLALYILMGIVALIGIVGNSCVCFIIARGKKMYTIANIFLLNLAIADILVLSICYPLSIIRNEISWPFGEIGCKLLPSLSDSFYGVSMGCITAISIYRYRMILHPMTTHMSFRHAKITIIVIWTISVCIISVPLFWVLTLRKVPKASSAQMAKNNFTDHRMNSFSFPNISLVSENATFTAPFTAQSTLSSQHGRIIYLCSSVWPSQEYLTNYQIIQTTWYFLPLSVILFTYIRIVIYLKKAIKYEWANSGDNSVAQSGLSSRVLGIKRAMNLLAPVVITFAVLMFPWTVIRILAFAMDIRKVKYIDWYISVAATMLIANSCSNPFIYYIMSKDFRDEFRRQLRALMRFTKREGEDSFVTSQNGCRRFSKNPTRVEMFTVDECAETDAKNHNVLQYTWEKYAARESDSPLPNPSSKQYVTFSNDVVISSESEKLIEPLPDPDRETII